MIKSWYLSVRDETMAPARMVSFMEQHATTCEVCLQDLSLKEEIAKITELVLPESKIPKAIRQQTSLEDDDDDSVTEDDSFVENEDENDEILTEEDNEVDAEETDPEEDEFLEDEDDD